MRLVGHGLVALAMVLSAQSASAQVSAPPIDETLAPYASTEDSVTLADGRALHFVCMGEGSPTVILTAGMGDFAGRAWSTVQPAMARTTRVCAWDRPGFGLSDGVAPGPTVATTAADLAAALAVGTIAGPYVMVGHSLGAYESLLFTDRHRDQVVGMVLVDPSFPDQQAVSDRVAPGTTPEPEQNPLVQRYRKCAAGIRAGSASPAGPDPDNCFAYPPSWPRALTEALRAKVANPVQYETMASFLVSSAEHATLAINPERDYGDLPLLVLTAVVWPVMPTMSEQDRQRTSNWIEQWTLAHLQLAALSTRGTNARVPGAHHYIQSAKPQVVIDAVEAVVREARDAGM